jgi:hypothetical protein
MSLYCYFGAIPEVAFNIIGFVNISPLSLLALKNTCFFSGFVSVSIYPCNIGIVSLSSYSFI